jgi:malonyl-CoA O-methyltransferase
VNKMPDSGKIAASFHKKAAEYDRHVLVQKRVVAQLAGSALLERLHAHYPAAGLTGVDVALNMCLRARQKLGSGCHIVNGDAESLPFGTGMFDLVVSASVLQWVGNLSAALHEMRRVVRPGGDIALAFFCDGSLGELQHCFRDSIGHCSAGGSQETSRLHEFRTVDDVKAIVSGMEFERFVVTVETEIDWYDDLHSLLRSIKNIGAGTVSGGAVSGLGWRGILQETSRLYRERYGVGGRIPATYKVLYLSAHV